MHPFDENIIRLFQRTANQGGLYQGYPLVFEIWNFSFNSCKSIKIFAHA